MERVTWLVCWWHSQTPYFATFKTQVGAEACAKVNNGLLVKIPAKVEIDYVVDWYRLDDKENPMPARQQSWKY